MFHACHVHVFFSAGIASAIGTIGTNAARLTYRGSVHDTCSSVDFSMNTETVDERYYGRPESRNELKRLVVDLRTGK